MQRIPIRSAAVPGARIAEFATTAGHLAPHRHQLTHVQIVLDGSMVDVSTFGRRVITRGEILFHLPGTLHENEVPASGGHGLAIDLDAPALGVGMPNVPAFGISDFHLTGIVGRMADELRRSDEHSPALLRALVVELSAMGARLARSPRPGWLLEAAAAVEADPGRFARMSDLARRLGVSKARLRSSVQRHYGVSVSEWLMEYRIRRAQMLLEGDGPISDVALECGFYDQAHFTRAFRRRLGITPGEQRRRLRADRALVAGS